MKKKLYFLFALLSMAPSMATQNVTKSLIIASTLVLSNTNSHRDFNITITFDGLRVSFNTYDKNLSLELHKAIEKGYYFSAQKLITNPLVDVNAKVDYYASLYKLMKNKGCTPLIQCCQKGDEALEVVRALLGRREVDVNLQTSDGWTPLIMCAVKGDKGLEIARALLGRKEIKVNLQDNDGDTPLDHIIFWIKDNKKNYEYFNLWHVLVAKGAMLVKRKKEYENLNPNNFQDPQKTYVRLIKQNPPKSSGKSKLMEEETKDDE